MVLSLPYAEWYLSRAYAIVSKKNYFLAKPTQESTTPFLKSHFWGESLYLFDIQTKNIS